MQTRQFTILADRCILRDQGVDTNETLLASLKFGFLDRNRAYRREMSWTEASVCWASCAWFSRKVSKRFFRFSPEPKASLARLSAAYPRSISEAIVSNEDSQSR